MYLYIYIYVSYCIYRYFKCGAALLGNYFGNISLIFHRISVSFPGTGDGKFYVT